MVERDERMDEGRDDTTAPTTLGSFHRFQE